MAGEGDGGGALSLRTLLVASSASAATAVIVHQLWQPGAIIGAAVTPVLVALLSEAIARPAARVTAVRRDGGARAEGEPGSAGAAGVEAGDVFAVPVTETVEPGELTERRIYRRRARAPRRLRLAVLVGLAAFVLGAVALTLSELVLDGAVANSDRTTLFGGTDRDEPSTDEGQDGSTTGTQETAPGTTQTEPAPTQSEPTTPPTTTPTAPTTPTEPAPTTPAPEGTPTQPTEPSAPTAPSAPPPG